MTHSIIPLSTWYPAMYARWVNDDRSRRLNGPPNRSGYTIHHTDGGGNQSELSYARYIADFHYFTRNWRRPGGYNFLIGTYGSIFEMCGWDYVGAHAPGCNYPTIGVALQGSFTRLLPSMDQFDAFSWLVANHHVPNIQQGHRDCSPSTCPGDTLYDELPLPVLTIPDTIPDPVKDIIMAATEEQLDQVIATMQDANTLDLAQLSVSLASYLATARDALGKVPDPISDAIWVERIAEHIANTDSPDINTKLREALERIKDDAPGK